MSKRSYVPPYDFAVIFAGLGDKDKALEWPHKAHEDRSASLVLLNVEPIWDSLRSDPRFTDLLRRMRLAERVEATWCGLLLRCPTPWMRIDSSIINL